MKASAIRTACDCRVTFALEEKNLPYDSVLIELRSKPHWYKEIVPTELTPAAVVNGELVYESLDILKVSTDPIPTIASAHLGMIHNTHLYDSAHVPDRSPV